jgi:hypothetical protein
MQRFTSGRVPRPIRSQAAVSEPDQQFLLLILAGLIVAAIGTGLGALATAIAMANIQ